MIIIAPLVITTGRCAVFSLPCLASGYHDHRGDGAKSGTIVF
jgi:hypothetical protein